MPLSAFQPKDLRFSETLRFGFQSFTSNVINSRWASSSELLHQTIPHCWTGELILCPNLLQSISDYSGRHRLQLRNNSTNHLDQRFWAHHWDESCLGAGFIQNLGDYARLSTENWFRPDTR